MAQQPLLGEFAPAGYDQWRALLKVDDFDRKLVTRTLDGLSIQPLYTPTDVPAAGFPAIAAIPGGSWENRQLPSTPSPDADPLGCLARTGNLAVGWDKAAQRLTALAKASAGTRSVIVSTSIYHDAGAAPALETGITLASYVTYLRWLTDGGLSVDDAVRAIEVSVSIGTDFFGEMAKLRALRLCLNKIIAHCGGTEVDALSIHARMSRRALTQRDPWVNMLRATTETFAAAAGGANAITTASYDLLLGTDTDLGKRIADNAQLILDEESHVRAVSDPAAGSYYIESLTQQLARAAWKAFNEIEGADGMTFALQDGLIYRLIQPQADAALRDVKTRKRPITGVSEFALITEPSLPDSARAATAAAPAAGAITIDPLKPTRLAEPYEALRDRSDAYLAAHGKRPAMFLCNVGTMAQWKPRAGFTQNFAWAGGIDALGAEQGYANVDEAVTAFKASGAALVAICSHDDLYPELVPTLATSLRDAGAKLVLVAGRPGEHEARYRQAGVGSFVYMGCDIVAALDGLLTKAGA